MAALIELNHVGLTVSDLDTSIDFYCNVVGFTVEGRYRAGGAWFDVLTRNDGAQLDVAMLRLDGFVLQLVEYAAGGGAPLVPAHNHAGAPHLCITVSDVDERHATIVSSGRHRPTPVVNIVGSDIRSFYVEDPDGVPVELLQLPS
ncbi:MAG: VOC family protein [Actinomycetota bacterium]